MRALITASLCLLFLGCGPYDGGDPRGQHDGGVTSQVALDGSVLTPEGQQERERDERLAKEEERQRREAQRAEAERLAAERVAAEAEAEVAAADVEDEAVGADGGDGMDGGSGSAGTVPPLPVKPELEGNLSALIADEEARAGSNGGAVASRDVPPPRPPGELAPAVIPPVDPLAPGAAPPRPDTVPPPAGLAPPKKPDAAPGIAPPPADIETMDPPGEPGSVAPPSEPRMPPVPPVASLTGDVLPPCDPNDLGVVALRDLSLKQTFGDGESARAVLRTAGGQEYVVARGSVVGPDGARVVRVSPGELILAEIQFDMAGQPVMVQKALRMELPR